MAGKTYAPGARRIITLAISLAALISSADAYDVIAAGEAANGSICEAVNNGEFYWEIGASTGGPIVSGQVGSAYDRMTTVPIASASKWIFGAYVVERFGGVPTGSVGAELVKALNMKSGYISFGPLSCVLAFRVKRCFVAGDNDEYTAAADGEFFYGGGHAQYIAATDSLLGLGAKTRVKLLNEINSWLALGPSFAYRNPGLAGGMEANAADYAAFLQRIMLGSYEISDLLNYSPVATAPCAVGLSGCSPVEGIDPHYSLHHWIEDDNGGTVRGVAMTPGDGSHSSPGALGFYPWISADMNFYGVISTDGPISSDPAPKSLACGRAIRDAFFSN